MTHRIEILGRVALSAAMLSTGCARSVNLLNPDTPRFVGEYATPVVATQAPGATLRVVTFNIKESREIDRAIAVLQSDSLRDADIVALQEMNETGVDRIARALKLNYAYYPALIHPVNKGYYGPAILSRWPIERSWKVLLPYEAWGRELRRTATAAVVRVNGLRVLVYSVHLETMVKLSDPQADRAGASGDGGRERVFRSGRDRGRPQRLRHGRPDPAPGIHLDDRMVGTDPHGVHAGSHPDPGPGASQPGSVGVVREVRGASDHHPVWAVLAPAPRSLSACRTGPEREISRQVAAC